jgi:glycerol-3-phosphate dehydrogenase
MKSFSVADRPRILASLETQELDVLIIGGGINGAGAARDAALRGLRVGLVEAQDFAQGTSSRSSKLIHGGIRYLENLEFKLVFEALNERTHLFQMAPHLVHPLRFMIPLYKDSRVSMFKMGLGMWLYDLLALFQVPEVHENLSAHETAERMPILNAQELCGSFVYSDAYMDDDRLVHETLRSANEQGALITNFVKALSAEFDENGKVKRVLCEDQISQRKFFIRARSYLSSVGPWTDQLGKSLDKNWKNVLRPTKGVHLTFSKDRLPMSSAVVMGAEKSDRIVFGIPRHEMVIVGTTDTDFKESADQVSVNKGDVEYLLDIARTYFPQADLKAEDILSSYAGVRPLVHDGSASEGKTSREHTIWTDQHGVTYVAGGKYTTYRLIAQQAIQQVLKGLSIQDRAGFKPADTTRPLNIYTGPDEYQLALNSFDQWKSNSLLSLQEIKLLAERHGLEAEQMILKYKDLTYWQIEAAHAIDNTMCLSLADFFQRRVPAFLSLADHGVQIMNEVAVVFQDKMGLSTTEIETQKKNYLKEIEHLLAWKAEFKK